MLANHTARKGLDSPHEIRGWRDTPPTTAVGMEGAPGYQARHPGAGHNNNGRGYYDNAPSKNSLCRRTAIDEVEGLAAEPVAGKTLHTSGVVRPEFRETRMVLLVRPYLDDDGVAPFEVSHPTPCCAAHG